jgi:hypothetical protein
VEAAQAQPALPLAYADDGNVADNSKAPDFSKLAVGTKAAKVELPPSSQKVPSSDLKVAHVDTAPTMKVAVAQTGAVVPQKAAYAELASSSQAQPTPAAAGAPDKYANAMAFLDQLSGAVDSGDLLAERPLTAAAMMDYAKRAYRVHPEMTASCLPACGQALN